MGEQPSVSQPSSPQDSGPMAKTNTNVLSGPSYGCINSWEPLPPKCWERFWFPFESPPTKKGTNSKRNTHIINSDNPPLSIALKFRVALSLRMNNPRRSLRTVSLPDWQTKETCLPLDVGVFFWGKLLLFGSQGKPKGQHHLRGSPKNRHPRVFSQTL